MALLRTFLTLGRACNLPTVWSNCIAGWWLGGGGPFSELPLLLVAASSLYLGGAFLNDAWDAKYDLQHRRNRPIPIGAIGATSVGLIAGVFLAFGLVSLFGVGLRTFLFGLVLAGFILLFDMAHRLITFSPALLGICRFWLYLVAASAGVSGVTGWAIWGGIALAAYVTGVASGGEHAPAHRDYERMLLLFVPIALAMVMNVNEYRAAGLLLSAVLGLWLIRCLRYTYWSSEPDPCRTRCGLLAGIVFVDWLAAANAPRELSVTLIGLFLLTLLCQRLARAAAP